MEISFEISQAIEQPIDKVFGFLRDFSNMPLWNYYIQSVTKLSEGDICVGSIFEMKRPHDLNTYKITELVYPGKIIFELQPPAPGHQLIFTLAAVDRQTTVNYKWNLDLQKHKLLKYLPIRAIEGFIAAIARKIILKKTKPAVEQNFKKLKELLEKGEATLQNGRRAELL